MIWLNSLFKGVGRLSEAVYQGHGAQSFANKYCPRTRPKDESREIEGSVALCCQIESPIRQTIDSLIILSQFHGR